MRIVDHTSELRAGVPPNIERGLTAVGVQLEGYAVSLCPVDTGRLKGSITFDVRDNTVYIGTNVEYAPYVEYGTGAGVGGRPTPWKYQDANGHWHTTTGSKPQPFIRPAVQNHLDEYQQILEQYLRG